MKALSIIVPVYNVEKYLRKSLESLVNQTAKGLEIIVVNDGATDNSQQIIDEFVSAYPGLVFGYQKENGGLSDARNYGMQFATGEYVCFLDSDDFIEQDAYEKMLAATDDCKKKIVACGFYKEWPSKSVPCIDSAYDNLFEYLKDGWVVAWNKLYKRDWLLSTGVIFPKGLLYEDVELFCKVMPFINSIDEIGFVNQPFVHYIQRTDSISYSETKRIKEFESICKNVLAFYSEKQVDKRYFDAVEYKFVKAFLGSYIIKYRQIVDAKLQKRMLKDNFSFVNKTFPNYKNNPYIQGLGIGNLYLRIMNKFVYSMMSKLPVSIIKKLQKGS